MMEWWGGLSGDLQIFYGLGILTSVLLVAQLLLNLIGVADDSAMDGGDFDVAEGADGLADGEHSTGLGLISTRTVIAFMAGFGWTGALVRTSGGGLVMAISAGVVVGFLLMLMVFWLMRLLYSLRGSGSLDYRNAIGAVGTVYVKIPASSQDTGQIQVIVQGRMATVSASTEDSEPITSGSKVRVVAVSAGNTLQVERV